MHLSLRCNACKRPSDASACTHRDEHRPHTLSLSLFTRDTLIHKRCGARVLPRLLDWRDQKPLLDGGHVVNGIFLLSFLSSSSSSSFHVTLRSNVASNATRRVLIELHGETVAVIQGYSREQGGKISGRNKPFRAVYPVVDAGYVGAARVNAARQSS